jgi:APA family basic amino acid/polyamine antiporter
MLTQLLRTKSLDAILADGESPQHQLKRTLGAFDVVMLGIGAIVGAGIFATIGTAAAGDATRPGAGPALVLSFVVTAVACGFAALCYAEFAAMVPISGSAYTYAYATLGELVAWIIGWDLIIEYAVGNVAVAISWGNYFKTLVSGFGITIPDWLSTDYRTAAHIPGLFERAPHLFGVPIVFNVLALAIVAAITVVLVIGVRESATMNAAMVSLKLLVLGFFVIVGWSSVHASNFTPFAPNGWAGVQAGAAIVFFAYIGFDAVSTLAEETRDPRRDLPIGIIGSLVICTVIYVVVAIVFTGIVPFDVLKQKLATEQAEPLTMALQYANIQRWGNLFVGIVAFGSVVAHTAVLLVFQLGQPRIFFSMARDGLLPKSFARVHPRFRTPHVTTILTGIAVGGCAMFTSIDEMVDLTNIGTLFAFILVCLGILILRRRDPARPRAFRTPWVPAVPLLGVVSCVYLMFGLPWITWIRFGLWLMVGLAVYYSYGYRNSGLRSLKSEV